jgi:hypothetical protein
VLIEDKDIPYAYEVVRVPKPDGSMRDCFDLRWLNKYIVPCHFPLSNVQDVLNGLARKRLKSQFDVKVAFYQLPLSQVTSSKIGIRTRDKLYRLLRLPMGALNSSAILEAVLTETIVDPIRKWCDQKKIDASIGIFRDNLVLGTDDETTHWKVVEQLGVMLKARNIRLNRKYQFMQTELDLLGFHLDEENNLRPVEKLQKEILEFDVPDRVRKVREFLGKINYFHEIVPELSIYTSKLASLTAGRKGGAVKFIWTKEYQDSFEKIKMLFQDPKCGAYDPEAPCEIYTDASQ